MPSLDIFFHEQNFTGMRKGGKYLIGLQDYYAIFYIASSIKDFVNSIEFYRNRLSKLYITQLGFHQNFKPIRKIGQGLTSNVYSGRRLIDGKTMAIKAIKKSSFFQLNDNKGKKAFLKQFKILSECNHKNICQFQGLYETQNTIYFVLEYYSISLASILEGPHALSKQNIIQIMIQLVQAVKYMNGIGIMHRDIKLENIMLKKQHSKYVPVIIDLGMAQYINEKDYIFQKCGTPGYAAPEMFKGKGQFPQKCDVFSLGVLFYILLFKKPLFKGSNTKQVIESNKKGQIIFDQQINSHQNKDVLHLLTGMLNKNVKQRFSIDEVIDHMLFKRFHNPKLETSPASTISCCFEIGQEKHELQFGICEKVIYQ